VDEQRNSTGKEFHAVSPATENVPILVGGDSNVSPHTISMPAVFTPWKCLYSYAAEMFVIVTSLS